MDLPLLYRKHSASAMAVAFRILHDACEAEDTVQDTFLDLLRRGSAFEAKRGSERAWISVLTRNRALDRLRTRARRARGSANLAIALEEQGEPPNDGAAERRVLDRALASLSDGQRRVLELAYFGDFSHREIALQTHTPLGTVKTRIRLGIERLSKKLVDARGSERPIPRKAEQEAGVALEVHATA